MAPVKKLLNMVGSCEIRGRLRCNAGSIGYRNRIRKALVHSRVTLVSWNRCQGINLRIRPSRRAVPSGLLAVGAIGNRLYTVSGDGQSAGNGIDHSAVPFNEILQVDLVLK